MKLTDHDIRRLRNAMRWVGTPDFFPAFRKLFRARVSFGTFLMIRFDQGAAPTLLDSWFIGQNPLDAELAAYIDTMYAFDPFYQFHDVDGEGGMYRLPEIAPDRFFSSEYYLEYYRKTGLCDEIGLLAPLPNGARAHLSISRKEDMGPYRRREVQCLKQHAPIFLELLSQHVSTVTGTVYAEQPEDPAALSELIQSHVGRTLATHLTKREAQVAELVLQGHSNGSAALVLGISRETCKVHRRNLYRKLAISSQRDLFGILKHLL